MSFHLIDRIVAHSRDHLLARKTVTRMAWPLQPACGSAGYSSLLILEGLAQCGGWLIKARREFLTLAIMSIVEHVAVHEAAFPGDALDYEVHLLSTTDDYGVVSGQARRNEHPVLTVEKILYFCRPVSGEEVNWGRRNFESLVRRGM